MTPSRVFIPPSTPAYCAGTSRKKAAGAPLVTIMAIAGTALDTVTQFVEDGSAVVCKM